MVSEELSHTKDPHHDLLFKIRIRYLQNALRKLYRCIIQLGMVGFVNVDCFSVIVLIIILIIISSVFLLKRVDQSITFVRFQVLTAASMMFRAVFWGVQPWLVIF
jgi:hypothetical protein